MINKLYNLKKIQTQQQILQKQQVISKISSLDNEIDLTNKNISTTTVQTIGAISDFKILEIHKNTMKNYIVKLNKEKVHLVKKIKEFDKIIIELNKETEQFKYIKQKQEEEQNKKFLKQEEEIASEYVQAQWKNKNEIYKNNI
jgi:hypothetical protein